MEDKALFPPVNPVYSALKGQCPNCGQGRLFKGFLTIAPGCQACGQKFDFADSGDGPAVFVIMIVGFVIVGLVLWLELSYEPPIWVHMVLWLPLTAILAAAVLRPLKGLMIGLQFKHKAEEGKLDD
ncbi:DUF983 domain-containing protein [Roseibium sediminis]|uniref:DUF983 domain-containing protein n=1 Tax=Roseibium sediminis TaxID=1775174 RepID=UPI00123DCCDB|nr:DUF983 domain-containing protein [Roseibium sediminis]